MGELKQLVRGEAYRTSGQITLSREPSWRAPDYDSPLNKCPKCRITHRNSDASYGWTWPRFCRGSWWRRLFRLCPDGEHMHQGCKLCKAKWTTGLEKSE